MSSSDNPLLPLNPVESQSIDCLIIAGEHSGDQHAARMVKQAQAENPNFSVVAVGGPALQEMGVPVLSDLTTLSVVGFVEVLKHYRQFKEFFDELLSWVETHRPRSICYVDYPGFNLRFAKALTEKGLSAKGGGEIKQLYYISPQIWAWKAKRRFKMEKWLDGLATIFPFEPKHYADTCLPAEFVGHPFIEENDESFLVYNPQGKLLLLPGSRKAAISRIFPTILQSLERITKEDPTVEALVIYPTEELQDLLQEIISKEAPEMARHITLTAHPKNGVRLPIRAVLTSSGTMSFQCALAGIPGALIYKAHPLTYSIGKRLIKVDYLGMGSLILGKEFYKEFIQSDATPEAIAEEIIKAWNDPQYLAKTTELTKELHEILSPPDTSAGKWLIKQTTPP